MGDAEMSQEVVKNYLVENGGVTRNVDLVRHFRKFLQSEDLASKERNREIFKNFVNALAAVKSEGGEKFIILKPKFYPAEWGGALPGSLVKTTPGASGRHGSNPDVSEVRASSPPRPLRLTVHIPGVVVPAVDSDNESDCVTSLSTFSLDSSVSSGYARKATNTTIKLMQNGGKAVRTNRIVDDRQGTRGAHAAPALLPGAGLIVPPRTEAPSTSMSGQSAEERDETSSISTASFSAFDYDMMDPLEHEWIMSAVQCSHETSQRLVETEPNLINKRAPISGYTALHWAAMNGNDVMLSTLLLNGADVNAKSMGLTPLHMAAQRGYDHIIQLLVTHYGALTDIRDNSGKRPRDVAKKTVSSRSRDLLDIGIVSPGKPRKRKNAMLTRRKSRSFSGSLPTIHLQSDEDFGRDDSMDGGGGVRSFFRSPLLSLRRSMRRKESLRRSRSGTVYD